MSKGYTGTILRVDLTTRKISKFEPEPDFYRTYMGGSALGAYFLLKETTASTDALDPENLVVIAPGVTTGAAVSGFSRCCVTSLSPLTGMGGDSQAGGSFGPALKRAGYDAIVVTGKADALCTLRVVGEQVEIREAAELAGKKSSEVLDILAAEIGDKSLSVLQCGPAGERLVRFACLMADRNDVAGRTGMGAVFGSKNLRAIAISGGGEVSFADPDGLRNLAREGAARLSEADFPKLLSQEGTPGLVKLQGVVGNLSTHNYSKGSIADYRKLDYEVLEPEIGAGATTCFGCVVRCRRKVRAEKPYPVSDKLGGPEFETLGLLGSNLDITDAGAVAHANELCGEYGMDTITMGGVAGYLFDCLDQKKISADDVGRPLRFGQPEDLFWLIEKIAQREGIGDLAADGFVGLVKKFGVETEECAIHVKNQGLAAHMPQMKPSLALMYAVCPIGPDHMSSEHDWLLASGGDEAWGLGIAGTGDVTSVGMDKVRMTVYSQMYYSLLDSLCLCMFCWGAGNLFNYRQLEDAVRFATGWDCSFWELMKVGERRINMMRQLNAKRGFSREQDRLPARLFQPFADGPSQGRCVDEKSFAEMLDAYYALMSWDSATGNPHPEKLAELGLSWTQ